MTPMRLGPLLYSAKLQWKRDLSQLPLLQFGSLASLAGLPNHSGGGSETPSDEAGMRVKLMLEILLEILLLLLLCGSDEGCEW
jgi:hypothetical protein